MTYRRKFHHRIILSLLLSILFVGGAFLFDRMASLYSQRMAIILSEIGPLTQQLGDELAENGRLKTEQAAKGEITT